MLGVHSRCGLHTRAVTVIRDPLSEGFRHFVASMPAPIASGWSEAPGGACTHLSGALVSSGNFQHRGLHFCGSYDGVGMIKRVIRDCSKQRQVRRAASVLSCGKDRINLSPVRSRDRDHNPAFSGPRGRTVGPVWKSGNEPSGCTVTHRPGAQALRGARVLGDL